MSVKERLEGERRSPDTVPTVASDVFLGRDAADLMGQCEELQARNDAKDELFGLVAHELRNPVTIALFAAHRLGTSGRLAPDEQETIGELKGSLAHLEAVIENMLTLARGEDPADLEPVLLQRLLPRSIARHAGRRPCRPMRLEVGRELPAVLGHEGWIDQVVENLLGNAEKYSPSDAVIRVSAIAEPDRVSIRVLDRGSGIAAGQASRLFAAFHRDESVTALPGLGLGLAVCKRLVERQGGEVWATPRLGGGSEFGFSLRRAE